MDILMPANPKTSIHQFVQQSLTASNVAGWINQLHPVQTMLKMPRFKSSFKIKLNDILKAMGMEEAFNPNKADFSNINPHARALQLYISIVKQKANITVNEKGSEAAAVTKVGISFLGSAESPPVFRVNRPFVYMIRERASGTILFMGVMRNPKE
jgi:serpin B